MKTRLRGGPAIAPLGLASLSAAADPLPTQSLDAVKAAHLQAFASEILPATTTQSAAASEH